MFAPPQATEKTSFPFRGKVGMGVGLTRVHSFTQCYRPSPRAMMLRWISEVPAPMTARRESRKKRCIGYYMQ